MAYYEAYDRAVDLTRNLADVTLIVPAQDWATRFTEMQAVFPAWVTTLIINYSMNPHPHHQEIQTTQFTPYPHLIIVPIPEKTFVGSVTSQKSTCITSMI